MPFPMTYNAIEVMKDRGPSEDTLVADPINYLEQLSIPDKKRRFSGTITNFRELFQGSIGETEPISEKDKIHTSVLSVAARWLSCNLLISTFSVGALSYPVFHLSFPLAVITIIGFGLLGTLSVAFFAIQGAHFRFRQMSLSSFMLGTVMVKALAVLRCLGNLIWIAINIVPSAQLLYLVGNHVLRNWMYCPILAGAGLLFTFVSHRYHRWSWAPPFAALVAILARLLVQNAFVSGVQLKGSDKWVLWHASQGATSANVLTFGALIFGVSAFATTYSVDMTIELDEKTPSYKIFFGTLLGYGIPLVFCLIIGAAAATGIKGSRHIRDSFNDHSVGGLIYEIVVSKSLLGFGEFLCCLLVFFSIYNTIPVMYSISSTLPSVWIKFASAPRIVYVLLGYIIAGLISVPILGNYEALLRDMGCMMGYFVAIYLAICLAEHYIFRQDLDDYTIEEYEDLGAMNPDYASLLASLLGVAGIVLGMSQTYYSGVISGLLSNPDLGFELAAVLTFLGYLIARAVENRYFIC